MKSDFPQPENIRIQSHAVELVGDHWRASGDSQGNVMLLHGGGQRRYSWHRTGERLAGAGWNTYAFDARGHGDSGWAPDGDYSWSASVEDTCRAIDAICEPPILVGASMGGIVSLILGGEHGPLCRGLVLVDIVARPDPIGVSRIQAFMTGAPEGFATLEEAADAIAAYNPSRPRSTSLAGLRKNLVQREDGRWRWHWDPRFLRFGSEPERNVGYEQLRRAAKNVTVPTLLVRGGKSDVVTEDGLKEMRGLIPHAESVEVESAGHMIAGDDNDVFTTELLRFINSTNRR